MEVKSMPQKQGTTLTLLSLGAGFKALRLFEVYCLGFRGVLGFNGLVALNPKRSYYSEGFRI